MLKDSVASNREDNEVARGQKAWNKIASENESLRGKIDQEGGSSDPKDRNGEEEHQNNPNPACNNC